MVGWVAEYYTVDELVVACDCYSIILYYLSNWTLLSLVGKESLVLLLPGRG